MAIVCEWLGKVRLEYTLHRRFSLHPFLLGLVHRIPSAQSRKATCLELEPFYLELHLELSWGNCLSVFSDPC